MAIGPTRNKLNEFFAKKNHIRLAKNQKTKNDILASAAFSVSFTGLSTDSLGSYGLIGNHAAISYTITPDLTTETVKWSNSSNPADAATFGTGANPTDFASVDGFSVWLHVTDDPGDGPVTRSFQFPANIALPATSGPIPDQNYTYDTGLQTLDVSTYFSGGTLTYSISGVPQAIIGPATGVVSTDTNYETFAAEFSSEFN